ncbi:hypothetical protein HDE_07660 [Halotydeus destructor]|nr:hypothetical protein HDE_07660 [Halotydeus destructor]
MSLLHVLILSFALSASWASLTFEEIEREIEIPLSNFIGKGSSENPFKLTEENNELFSVKAFKVPFNVAGDAILNIEGAKITEAGHSTVTRPVKIVSHEGHESFRFKFAVAILDVKFNSTGSLAFGGQETQLEIFGRIPKIELEFTFFRIDRPLFGIRDRHVRLETAEETSFSGIELDIVRSETTPWAEKADQLIQDNLERRFQRIFELGLMKIKRNFAEQINAQLEFIDYS